ncbi:MAG: 5-methyltetrahydropteroyltriglutamate--homocysteine S-methyltransferase [Xanthobacteraceae bacterium]|nr:5-methyltetrahydropteroyltriglutamate--homocysteine S-methyltransferase [Xanthobacteraceae bacterium]
MSVRTESRPPFRADHVGSLLRPAALRNAFRRHQAREIDETEFSRVQDQCIRDAVRMQEETGFAVVTDGEFRRASYWARFIERIEGFGLRASVLPFKDDQGRQNEFIAPHVTGKIRRTKPLAVDEFEFLTTTAKATPKVTLPSPSTMHFYGTTDYRPPSVYGDFQAFFADLSRAFAEEVAALAAAGCRYVQLDEVAIVLLADPLIRDHVKEQGADPDKLVDLYIEATNQALAGRPADVAVGFHICRGNYKGRYLGEGGYDALAERIFGGIDATHFLLEYDTPRAGGFAPLRAVPKDKGVVLGLISSKVPELEDLDTLKRRVEEAARHIDVGRLAVGPQCGFASAAVGNPLTEAEERAKLRRTVELAQAIWK